MSENPRDLPDVVAPPPLLYAVPLVLALIVQHYFPRRLLPAAGALMLGVVLGGLSLVGFLGVVAFRRAATSPNPYRPSNALVVGGPFRLTRNPMYVGFTLM
ncbi:MAG: isoprenylcysteine carboxylmethyltransferase family protein, partial [Gemmatimonadota bacterium]